jgi:hypothetical protein
MYFVFEFARLQSFFFLSLSLFFFLPEFARLQALPIHPLG